MYIFDSVKKEKLLFTPIDGNNVTLYVCGPTVYDDAHLGHAKSSLVFDLLYRVLEANGYSVTYAKNITDIDDKIIKKATELNITIDELTSKYLSAYNKDMDSLGVKRPTLEPKATESIEAMIDMIQKLIDSNHAYITSTDDVYFDTSSDNKYLSISNRHQDESDTMSRVESSSEKKNSTDFALWKGVSDDSVAYETPFGKGRPGWHLECSAMIEKHLKSENSEYTIDIHGGGADLLFPHHENEAAQSRCATKKELAKYWVHNGFVNIDGEKMSKSLGNSFFIKDALKSYSGEVLRFYLLSTNYRANFNFNEEDLIASKKRLDKLYRLKKRLYGMKIVDEKTTFKAELLEALNDDLNVSKAYALIDEMISTTNEVLDANPKDKLIKRQSLSNMEYVRELLGFGEYDAYEYFQFGISEDKKSEIESLIAQRSEAKKEKNFELSDSLRDQISELGVSIMDTANGTLWENS